MIAVFFVVASFHLSYSKYVTSVITASNTPEKAIGIHNDFNYPLIVNDPRTALGPKRKCKPIHNLNLLFDEFIVYSLLFIS